MYFLPYARIRINSSLSPDELRSNLMRVLDKERWIRHPFNDDHSKEFEGKIDADRFKISRIIGYRNSFNPVIIGRLDRGIRETLVHIKFRLHAGVLFFAILWNLICTGGVIGTIYSVVANGDPFFVPLIPFGMILFFWITSSGFLHLERRRSEKALCRIWEGTVEREFWKHIMKY